MTVEWMSDATKAELQLPARVNPIRRRTRLLEMHRKLFIYLSPTSTRI